MPGHPSPFEAIGPIVFFLLGATLTAALCRFALPLGRWLGVIDEPVGSNGHKSHPHPTPAVGGVIIAVVSLFLFFSSMPWSIPEDTRGRFIRAAALWTVMVVMLIGFFDDRRHIPAVLRLGLGIAVYSTLLLLVPQLQLQRVEFVSIGLSMTTGILALPFTVLCLLALKNAINMADGRNGLLLGMAIIWSIFFLLHAVPHIFPTLLGVLGGFLVLLAYNWRGKLFMGDCGSYGLATYFGILALSLHKDTYGSVRTAEVVLLFLIPVLDTSRLIIERIAQKKSPLAPDGQHLHHLLERATGWTTGWWLYMALIAIPLVIYQFLPGQGIPIILVSFAAYALVIRLCRKRSRTVLDEIS